MPALEARDSVRVRRQRFYLPGDVVVVRRRDHWNVHRFLGYALGMHGLAALTQADDTPRNDPAATADAIVGRADCRVTVSDRCGALRNYASAVIRRFSEVGR